MHIVHHLNFHVGGALCHASKTINHDQDPLNYTRSDQVWTHPNGFSFGLILNSFLIQTICILEEEEEKNPLQMPHYQLGPLRMSILLGLETQLKAQLIDRYNSLLGISKN